MSCFVIVLLSCLASSLCVVVSTRHVNEVAGRLQGLMPGDLGEMGSASLNEWQLSRLLDIVVTKTVCDESDVSGVDRAQLELAARLLCAAQRCFWSHYELKELSDQDKDPTDALVAELKEAFDEVHNEYLRIPILSADVEPRIGSVSSIVQAPFAKYILAPLCRLTPSATPDGVAGEDGHGDESDEESFTNLYHPVVNELWRVCGTSKSSAKRTVPLLQIICAASEIFPAGASWTSSACGGWKTLPAVEKWGMGPSSLQICSPTDLAVVVYLITSLLVAHGGSGGDFSTQKWALLALQKLTYSTAVQSFFHQNDAVALGPLQSVWRWTWSVLFRLDLRYAASTRLSKEGDVGQLVLQVLEGIARHVCTDPALRWSLSVQDRQTTFLFLRQEDIWRLPVFRDPSSVDGSACANLIYAVVFSVGLAEGTSDALRHEYGQWRVAGPSAGTAGRRLRLLDFCFGVIESLRISKDDIVAALFAQCAACLVQGCDVTCPLGGPEPDSLLEDLENRDVPMCSVTRLGGDLSVDSLASRSTVKLLWSNFHQAETERLGLFFLDKIRSNVAESNELVLRLALTRKASEFRGADMVAYTTAAVLQSLSYKRVSALSFLQLPSSETQGSTAVDQCKSLCLRTLAIRLRLSVLSPQFVLNDDSLLGEVFDDIAFILRGSESIVSMWRLGSFVRHEGLPLQYFVGVWKIVGFVQDTSGTTFRLTPNLIAAATELFNVLMDALGASGPENLSSNSRPPCRDESNDSLHGQHEGSTNQSNVDVLDDEIGPVGQKRKRKEREPKRARRKGAEVVAATPFSRDFVDVSAALLVRLAPSFEVCDRIARTMLGVEELTDRDYPVGSIDLRGAIQASTLLATEPVFLHRTARSRILGLPCDDRDRESIVSLVGRILSAICSDVPDPLLQSFCLRQYVSIVRWAEAGKRGTIMTGPEAASMAAVLTDLHGGRFRCSVRATQVRAASISFLSGKENYRSHVERDFPRDFAVPSLLDVDGVVRRQAAFAVAAAVRILPEDKVVNQVKKRLPPIVVDSDCAKGAFRKWYSGKVEANDTTDQQMWEDAFFSIAVGAIDCWTAIATAASDDAILDQVLFDLVVVSHLRPELQWYCFHAVDEIAVTLGYDCTESILEAKTSALLDLWIEEETRSLFDMPMLLSCPRVMRRLIFAGFTSSGGCGSKSSAINVSRIREEAATDAIVRQRHSLVPRIVERNARKLLESSVTKEGRRRLLDDRYLKELCSAFADQCGDDVAKALLKKCAPDIIGHETALLFCKDEDSKRVGRAVHNLLAALLTEDSVKRQGERGMATAVRRFFSDGCRQGASSNTGQVLSGLKDLLVRYGGTTGSGEANAIQSLLLANIWLLSLDRRSQSERSSCALQAACDLIAERIDANARFEDVHLGLFSIQVLSKLLGNHSRQKTRPSAIKPLDRVLSSTLVWFEKTRTGLDKQTKLLRAQLESIAEELIFVCIQAHESCRVAFLSASLRSWRERQEALWTSLGVLALGDSAAPVQAFGDQHALSYGTEDATLIAKALAEKEVYLDEDASEIVGGTKKIIERVLHAADLLYFDLDVGESRYEYHSEELAVLLAQVSPALTIDDLVKTVSPPHLMPSRLDEDVIDKFLSAFVFDVNDARCRLSQVNQCMLEARLARLEAVLRSGRSDNLLERREGYTVERLIRSLSFLCRESFAGAVRQAATRCLGEISLESIDSSSIAAGSGRLSPDMVPIGLEPIGFERSMVSRCVLDLVQSLKMPDKHVVVIALETLKASLSAVDASVSVELICDRDAKGIAEFFVAMRSDAPTRHLLLLDQEISRLRRRATTLFGVQSAQDEWCWDSRLWEAGSLDSVSFEEWVRIVVPSILVCYPTPSTSSSYKGASVFASCQRMCCIDPLFARSLFPAVLLDLLQREANSCVSDHEADHTSMLGDPNGELNTRISKCFSALLKDCVNCQGRLKDTRGVELVLDTLDYFRQLTQHRFVTSSKHVKNGRKTKEVDTQETGSSTGTQSIRRVGSDWRGVTFGTILNVDGLLVAEACLRVGRYASALFFADLYADNRFGGSTRALQLVSVLGEGVVGEVALSGMSTPDISGFLTPDHDHAIRGLSSAINGGITPREECVTYLTLLRDCFYWLDWANGKTVEMFLSNFLFASNSATEVSPPPSFENESASSLEVLRQLDNRFSSEIQSGAGLAVGTSLARLGLPYTAQSCITGFMASGGQNIRRVRDCGLREKWFECALYQSRWSDRFLIGDFSGPNNFSFPASTAGFHESILQGLQAMASDDFMRCRVKLGEARLCLMGRVPSLVQPESPLLSIMSALDRARAVNEIETVVSKAKSIEDVLGALRGMRTSPSTSCLVIAERNLSGGSTQFSDCLRELMLRCTHRGAARVGRDREAACIMEELQEVLSTTCTVECSHGRYEGATGALERLGGLIRLGEPSQNATLPALRLRIKEAQVLELRGDFSKALDMSDHAVQLLQKRPAGDARDSLLAEALIVCGHWMAKHKVKPADSILDNYLKPASEIASALHLKHKSATSAARAARAWSELGQLASSLFDTVSSRIKSPTWQRAGTILLEQESDRDQCAARMEDLHKSMSEMRSKSPEYADAERQMREINTYHNRLERQIQHARREREKVERSVEDCLSLAFNAIVSALSIANQNTGLDLSWLIYRMISLWFTAQDDGRHDCVQAAAAEAVEKVPSFRFVPLASQLFSRLSQTRKATGPFYSILQDVALKMCREHPYHCIVHVIFMSNGRDDSDSSKVDVAASLLKRLDTTGDVCALVDSYRVLSEAYIDLAKAPAENLKRGESIQISRVCKAGSRRLDKCIGSSRSEIRQDHSPCVLTSPPKLRPDGDYTHTGAVDKIKAFEAHFSIADGGINCPKIITCIGSSGTKYKQLVKKDEIRQDAVMEQVFGYVNELMARNVQGSTGSSHALASHASSQSALRVVTYNIVPLSPTFGVSPTSHTRMRRCKLFSTFLRRFSSGWREPSPCSTA